MARVKFGSLVSSISGSVGGSTFQNSIYGPILRSKPIPLLSRSELQSGCRSLMQKLQSSWLSLTPASRSKWAFFVAFSSQHITRDEHYLISGYNLYLKYQFIRSLYSLPLLTSWTYNPLLVYPKTFQLNKIPGNAYIYFDSTVDANKYFFAIKLSFPHSAAASYTSRNSHIILPSIKSDYLYYIGVQYISAFGRLPNVGETLSWSLYWFSLVNPILTGYSKGTLIVGEP